MSQVVVERVPTTSPLAAVAPATLAGIGFVSLAVTQLVFPHQTDPFSRTTDYIIEASYAVALWASVLAVLGLHRTHRGRPGWGRLGAIGAAAFGVGHALLGTAVATTAVQGHDSLGPLFLPGLVGWLAGGVILAVAAFRARLLPRPLAVAFGLSLPATMAVGHAGPLIAGAIWLATAAVIARANDA